MRRTVGAEALETLRGQDQSIASVAASVNSLQGDVIGMARMLAKLREDSADGVESVHREVKALAEVVRCLQQEHVTFKRATAEAVEYVQKEAADRFYRLADRTFWGRLRWLILGR